MKTVKHRRTSALSFVELIILVSVIGVLGAIGVITMGIGVLSGSQSVKREQDLRVLNSAVSAYLLSGGDLSGAATPGDVVAKLKSRASEEQQRRIPGLSGNFLDPAVELVMQTEEEARTDDPRLRWNPETNHFEISDSGAPGIRTLGMQRLGAGDSELISEDRTSAFKYSAEGTWIWDYQEIAPSYPAGPDTFSTTSPADSSLPAPAASLPVAAPRNTLQPPLFSITGGRYPAYDFNMPLSLDDPNPPGASRIYYSINYGNWVLYTNGTPISVIPDTSIKAQAIPVDPELWNPSAPVDELYFSYEAKLLPPTIDFSAASFLTDKTNPVDTISVTLADPNKLGTSAIMFQLLPMPGGSGPTTEFQLYAGSFSVSSSTYPNGFGVRAFASAVKVGYEDSRIETRFATERKGLFGGHLDLDTSVTVAEVGSGSTEVHTHDITGKYGISAIDFFKIPDSSQIEITEAIPNTSQKFKLIVVNADLSPGMTVIIDYESNGTSRTVDAPVDRYDDTAISDLTVFSLGGANSSAKLTRLQLVMSQDVIYTAGVIPTVTSKVKSNVLGKEGEWRNGALTIQAVAVNDDESEAFFIDPNRSTGDHGVAVNGLLWEAALFWHWGGDSYDQEANTYKPGQFDSVRIHVRD